MTRKLLTLLLISLIGVLIFLSVGCGGDDGVTDPVDVIDPDDDTDPDDESLIVNEKFEILLDNGMDNKARPKWLQINSALRATKVLKRKIVK